MIEYLPLVLTGLGLSASILYYTITLRNANKTQQMQLKARQTQIFMQVYNQVTSPEFFNKWRQVLEAEWTNNEDYEQKYGFFTNPEFADKLYAMLSVFEGLGVLVKRELVDLSLVDDLVSIFCIRLWEKYEPIMLEQRKQRDWPNYMQHVEHLYNELKPLHQTT